MTTLVKSPCVGCRFAEWERSANGKALQKLKSSDASTWETLNEIVGETRSRVVGETP